MMMIMKMMMMRMMVSFWVRLKNKEETELLNLYPSHCVTKVLEAVKSAVLRHKSATAAETEAAALWRGWCVCG